MTVEQVRVALEAALRQLGEDDWTVYIDLNDEGARKAGSVVVDGTFDINALAERLHKALSAA